MRKSLKEYRKSQQLSQHELSDKAGISIRTIQRIEKRLSQGSPYIIKSLCKALQIEVDDLEFDSSISEMILSTPAIIETNAQEGAEPFALNSEMDRTPTILKLINFSSIFILLFPFLNVIVPSVIYWKHKGALQNKAAALKIISFQIIWTLGTLIVLLFLPPIIQAVFGLYASSGFPVIVLLYSLCVLLNIFATFATAVNINKSADILHFIPTILPAKKSGAFYSW